MILGNWSDTPTARTYRQVNGTNPVEIVAAFSAIEGDVLVAYYADAGAAGAKTVGITAPSGDWQVAAVEIRGSSAPPPPQEEGTKHQSAMRAMTRGFF
jgi:hypothetical protein